MKTLKFREVYNNADDFYTDYQNLGIPTTITQASCKTVFYLLYAEFAGSHFCNSDLVQSKMKIFKTIYEYGPAWETRIAIQKSIRELDLDELREGTKQISNHANNPNTAPSTAALEELEYIDEQHAVNYKKNKLDAYASMWNMIATDVTKEFIDKFRKIFKAISIEEEVYLFEEEV